MTEHDKKKKWIVYMHTSPSGKKYVGITSQGMERRARKNGIGYSPERSHNRKKGTHFWNAIQKYGWDNFKHEILYNNLTEEEAKQLEKKLILEMNLTDPNIGYNMSAGGDGASIIFNPLYEDCGEYVILKLNINNPNVLLYVDKDDYEKVIQYQWCITHRQVVRTLPNEYGKTLMMYSLIFPHYNLSHKQTKTIFKHKNGNLLDFRKSNIELKVLEHMNLDDAMNYMYANTTGISHKYKKWVATFENEKCCFDRLYDALLFVGRIPRWVECDNGLDFRLVWN